MSARLRSVISAFFIVARRGREVGRLIGCRACFLSLALFASCPPAEARTWVLDNDVTRVADFRTFDAAQAAASAGDTIMLNGSGANYGELRVTKRLHLVGPGYLLGENGSSSVSKLAASFAGVTFVGSEASGSSMTGLSAAGGRVTISDANNVTVRRCYFGTGNLLSLTRCSNVIITQNFGPYVAGSRGGPITGLVVRNNYLNGMTLLADGNAVIANNIIYTSNASITEFGRLDVQNSTVENNISITGKANVFVNCTVRRNVSTGSDVYPAANNRNGVELSSLFVDSGTTDGRWQLKPGSPAASYATDSGDVGMYGGSEPYRLSGIPSSLPRIVELDAPNTASPATGLRVRVRAQAGD